MIVILLKNPLNASTGLSTNGKSPMIGHASPFILRHSKDERGVSAESIVMPDPLLADVLESFVGCMKGVAPGNHTF